MISFVGGGAINDGVCYGGIGITMILAYRVCDIFHLIFQFIFGMRENDARMAMIGMICDRGSPRKLYMNIVGSSYSFCSSTVIGAFCCDTSV
jgi:hypothetical protein